jgi:hypothetical protein
MIMRRQFGNPELSVFFADLVNSADVRMIDCRRSLCLTLEASQRLGITCELRRQEF